MLEVTEGVIDQPTAIEKLTEFDRGLHQGQLSPTGSQLIAGMRQADVEKRIPVKVESPPPANAGVASSHTDAAPTPPVHSEAPAPTPAKRDDASTAKSNGDVATHGTWTPPPNAVFTDEEIARLGAALHDPKVDHLLLDLAGVMTLEKELLKNPEAYEVHGKQRENMVAGIGTVRAQLLSLDATKPDVVKFQVAVNHLVERLSPYHSQVNIRTIESGQFTTCNVTSLAMSLETIGKNADSYKPSKRAQIVAVAKKYSGDVAKATNTNDGNAAAWESLRGLRLPDFMEFAAIAHELKTAIRPTKISVPRPTTP